MMITYKQLKERHPEYYSDYWHKLYALYAGGHHLLNDECLLEELFPRNNAEDESTYKERCARAMYIPYAGEIIDSLVSSLCAEPIVMDVGPDHEIPDKFYSDRFYVNVSPDGAPRVSLNEFLKRQIRFALIYGYSWTLVDFPAGSQVEPNNLLEEESLGLRNAYAIALCPEDVIDWEDDENGELLWVLTLKTDRKRGSINESRSRVKETYTYYTRSDWTRFWYEYPEDKEPKDDATPDGSESGVHNFNTVPLKKLKLPDGLWAMNKIGCIAAAHFNLRNALTWGELRSLFPILAHYAQEESPLSPISENPDRATTQTYGPGYVAKFAEKDRLEYTSAPTAPFLAALKDLDNMRDEMHRVLHSMAMSVDNSAAAMQRSAESKSVDRVATAIILRALGGYLRDHALEIYELISIGRGDNYVWEAHGFEKFDDVSVTALVSEAQSIDIVDIPSATFHRLYKGRRLAPALLGAVATDKDLKQIDKELGDNLTNEYFETSIADATIEDSADEAKGE